MRIGVLTNEAELYRNVKEKLARIAAGVGSSHQSMLVVCNVHKTTFTEQSAMCTRHAYGVAWGTLICELEVPSEVRLLGSVHESCERQDLLTLSIALPLADLLVLWIPLDSVFNLPSLHPTASSEPPLLLSNLHYKRLHTCSNG